MCGIVGVIGDRDLELGVIDAMRDRLAHRGPDGARSWLDRGNAHTVGLGHRRLSIIDLSAAADQPMFAAGGLLAIVYNGEIYNYLELRDELVARGRHFQTRSDTEVLMSTYQEWGTDCLSHLNGMFAFAIWDARAGHLFIARDRFGEKPLFYAQVPGRGLAFASEMKALFAHPRISAALDRSGLAAYIAGPYYESDELTLFDGVRRLPPAHALLVGADGRVTRSWRWWTPDYTAVNTSYNAAEAVDRFGELMSRSVSMRLRSDVPVGSSLSGGLDSSTIVCLVSGMRGDRGIVSQNTFSGRFDNDPTLSEGSYIDAVVKSTGVNAYAVAPDPARLIEESRLVHYHQEEPFLSASIYLQWCVNRLAAENRTTVILDGQGADELLAGYQFYYPSHQLDLVERRDYWRAFTETLRFSSRLRGAARPFEDYKRRFNPDVATPLRTLLGYARHGTSAPVTDWSPPGLPPAERGKRLRRRRAEALLYQSLPQLLRYADRNAMAFSREIRLPFLDYDLVDFVLTLPDSALVGEGWQKLILRKASRGLVPRQIVWRADKMGYAAPLDRWLREGLKEWARERVFSGPITKLEGYDREHLQTLWHEHETGSAERSWALWRWISLNEWLQLFEDGVWSNGWGPSTSSRAAPSAIAG